jgi:hypothetical protein
MGLAQASIKKYWQFFKQGIFNLFNQFRNQTADVSAVNRA